MEDSSTVEIPSDKLQELRDSLEFVKGEICLWEFSGQDPQITLQNIRKFLNNKNGPVTQLVRVADS